VVVVVARQVVNFSACVQLKALYLGGNQLQTLRDSGLGSCTSLEVLDVANNNLRDSADCWYFALLPSLQVLNTIGNPMMAAKTSRYARCCY
jgi:hypothetical protein